MWTRLPFAAWLVTVWVALWAEVSLANVLGGVAVAAVLLVLFPHAGPGPAVRLRPWRAVVFLAYFLAKLVEANAVVAWEVLTPNNERIREGVVAVPLVTRSRGLATLVANAVTLTPGTLTLEVRRDPPTLYVHVLHLRSLAEARAAMQRLERLALAAFGSDDELATARRLPGTGGGEAT